MRKIGRAAATAPSDGRTVNRAIRVVNRLEDGPRPPTSLRTPRTISAATIDLVDVKKADVALATFDAAYVAAVEFRDCRQFFLRNVRLSAKLPNPRPKRHLDGFLCPARHLGIPSWLLPMSPRTPRTIYSNADKRNDTVSEIRVFGTLAAHDGGQAIEAVGRGGFPTGHLVVEAINVDHRPTLDETASACLLV